MSFITALATPSTAVASGSTLAFTFGSALQGVVQYEGNHVLYAEGLGALFTFPNQFTLGTWTATGVTVTYNGTTPIPAGTLVRLQLEAPGENNYLTTAFPPVDTIWDYQKVRPLAALGRVYRVLLGAPAAASATAIANAVVTPTTGVTVTLATPYQMDVARGISVKSSSASDITPSTVTVRSLDVFGNAVTETLTLNGTTAVNGKKAHYLVLSYTPGSTQMVGNLSIGTGAGVFGLPFFLSGGTSAGAGGIVKENIDGTSVTTGTFVGGDLANATATTGDVRGTYTPATAPNGTHYWELLVYGSDLTFRGNPQYAG